MTARATHARGPRGDYRVGRGDLTGARAVTARDQAEANAQAVDRAVTELRDPDTQLAWVDVPGRSARYPLPRVVLDAIKRSAR